MQKLPNQAGAHKHLRHCRVGESSICDGIFSTLPLPQLSQMQLIKLLENGLALENKVKLRAKYSQRSLLSYFSGAGKCLGHVRKLSLMRVITF